ncbi:unnamed protein product [Rotaria magnacalcarata]|uniref:Uncharacterized protein n=1 Tax=Rotaria magnacalcarata TaxID=392030 RepID=A0A8S2IF89_9BILA|nr:unnamed protein product [Rotaria magnacalcarata]
MSSIASLISILSGLTTRILPGYAVDLTNTIGWLFGTQLKCYGKTDACRLATDFTYALVTIIIPILIMICFGLLTISNIQESYRRVFMKTETQLSINVPVATQKWRKTDFYLLLMLFVQQFFICCVHFHKQCKKSIQH